MGKKEIRTYRINPERHIPEETTKIHGISDEDVKDKPTFKQLGELNAFIGNADLAGYNSNKFDVPLLVELRQTSTLISQTEDLLT